MINARRLRPSNPRLLHANTACKARGGGEGTVVACLLQPLFFEVWLAGVNSVMYVCFVLSWLNCWMVFDVQSDDRLA